VAGYVQGQSGQRYTLVAVLHHPNAHQARAALDQLLEWTVRDTAAAIAATHRPNTGQHGPHRRTQQQDQGRADDLASRAEKR
jgi:D-alanyl-D-alanine carboxypeptidase